MSVLTLLPLSGIASHRVEATAEQIADIFADRTSASRVGAAYLDAGGDTTSDLIAEVKEALGLESDGWPILSTTEKRKLIARAISDDFLHGRTCVVRGWLMSVTEARLCALLHVVS